MLDLLKIWLKHVPQNTSISPNLSIFYPCFTGCLFHTCVNNENSLRRKIGCEEILNYFWCLGMGILYSYVIAFQFYWYVSRQEGSSDNFVPSDVIFWTRQDNKLKIITIISSQQSKCIKTHFGPCHIAEDMSVKR